MRARVLESVKVGGVFRQPGDVCEVDDELGSALIGRGLLAAADVPQDPPAANVPADPDPPQTKAKSKAKTTKAKTKAKG